MFINLRDRPVREYQSLLVARLSQLFPDVLIQKEWPAVADEDRLYCTRFDVAVGPFATHDNYTNLYDSLMFRSERLIEALIDCHQINVRQFDEDEDRVSFEQLRKKNRKSRCFIAIEVENRVSRKHLMGGAINAAALGRIGLAVAWNQEKLTAFVKMRRYLRFLASVGKNSFDTTNLLILTSDQLLEVIEATLGEQV